MIKTVVFDIGRVLIGFEWKDYVNRLFQPEVADAVTAAAFGGPYWKELDRGVMPLEEIFEKMLSLGKGHETEVRKALDCVGECTTRTDYAIPWIKSLKERGYQVLYLSNFSHYVMKKGRHTLDFLPYMDGGIISCEEKCIKPAEEIYKKLLNRYELEPEECVFIDDTATNIETARKLGMHGVVFENYEQAKAELEENYLTK